LRLERALVHGDRRNLDLVRRLFEASQDYLRGERAPFEAAVEELCSAEILLVPSSGLASGDPGPYRGRESLIRQQAAVRERWAGFEVTPDDYVEVPPSTVVMLGKLAARRGDGSGYATEVGIVYRLEDGQIVEMHSYQSKRRALEEAGIPDLAGRAGSDQQPDGAAQDH
jgi:ketosteroid isomerase-like protein